jgi:hypothetical protein
VDSFLPMRAILGVGKRDGRLGRPSQCLTQSPPAYKLYQVESQLFILSISADWLSMMFFARSFNSW